MQGSGAVVGGQRGRYHRESSSGGACGERLLIGSLGEAVVLMWGPGLGSLFQRFVTIWRRRLETRTGGSGSGSVREAPEEEAAHLPVGRVVQEVDRHQEGYEGGGSFGWFGSGGCGKEFLGCGQAGSAASGAGSDAFF